MNPLVRSVSNLFKQGPAELPVVASAERVNVLSPVKVQDVFEATTVSSNHNFIDMIARDNEAVRNKCSDIVRKIEEAANLHRDLASVFVEVDGVLAESEKTKSDLIQRTSALAFEREAHGALKAAHREASDALAKVREEAAALAAEKKRQSLAVAELEVALGTLRLSHAEKHAQHADLLRQTASDGEKMAAMAAAIATSHAELQRADALIVSLQGELACERDRATLAEEDARSLHSALAETRQSAAKTGRALDEATLVLESGRKRIADLEAGLAFERGEHSKFHSLWQQESDGRRADVSTLQIKIEAQASRIEASDRLLAAARGQFQTKVEELRKEERRAQEVIAGAAALEKKLRAFEGENAELRGQMAAVEKARDTHLERADHLTKAVRAKESVALQVENKLNGLGDRLSSETQRFETLREQYEQRIQQLTVQLEKEKLDRALAQGALDVARKDRNRPQAPAAAEAPVADDKVVPLVHATDALKRLRANGAAQELPH